MACAVYTKTLEYQQKKSAPSDIADIENQFIDM
jgi:hypothetical protein